MYLPTRSASAFVLALTKLWTLKPLCRQERILSARSGLSSSLRIREMNLKKRARVMAQDGSLSKTQKPRPKRAIPSDMTSTGVDT